MGSRHLSEISKLTDQQWEELLSLDWNSPSRISANLLPCLERLRALENEPSTAIELFGEDPTNYRNGPCKINEIIRKSGLPYRLKRIQHDGVPFQCEAGERYLSLAYCD